MRYSMYAHYPGAVFKCECPLNCWILYIDGAPGIAHEVCVPEAHHGSGYEILSYIAEDMNQPPVKKARSTLSDKEVRYLGSISASNEAATLNLVLELELVFERLGNE